MNIILLIIFIIFNLMWILVIKGNKYILNVQYTTIKIHYRRLSVGEAAGYLYIKYYMNLYPFT